MKKILIIYHRVDFDGIFSCCIARDYFSQDVCNDIYTFGWNYNDELPEKSFINRFDIIFISDISLTPEFMLYLKSTNKDVIWIDHHITAINDSIKYGYSDLPGIRNIYKSACEYCWDFLFPDMDCPIIIKYIGAYDIWNKDDYDWYNVVLPVQYGFRSTFGVSEKNIWNEWRSIVSDDGDGEFLEDIMHDGKVIYDFKQRSWKSAIKNYGFPVKVAGKYNAICLLSTEFGSVQFESVLDDYDIYIVINRRGDNSFNISMYKESDRLPEFSCGGYRNIKGHKDAGGGTITLDDFINILQTKEY